MTYYELKKRLDWMAEWAPKCLFDFIGADFDLYDDVKIEIVNRKTVLFECFSVSDSFYLQKEKDIKDIMGFIENIFKKGDFEKRFQKVMEKDDFFMLEEIL